MGKSVSEKKKKAFLDDGREEAPAWDCLFVHRQQGQVLSMYVDDIKICWGKGNSGTHAEQMI